MSAPTTNALGLEIGGCTCGNCRWCGYRPGFEPVAPLVPQPIHVIDYGQYNSRPMPEVPRYTFTPYEPRISDEDVERIARRVAELLKP